jgi:hypothetical protein
MAEQAGRFSAFGLPIAFANSIYNALLVLRVFLQALTAQLTAGHS